MPAACNTTAHKHQLTKVFQKIYSNNYIWTFLPDYSHVFKPAQDDITALLNIADLAYYYPDPYHLPVSGMEVFVVSKDLVDCTIFISYGELS